MGHLDMLRRLYQPALNGQPPAWNRSMSLLALGALMLAVIMTAFDFRIAAYAAASPRLAFDVLAAVTDVGLAKWYWPPALIVFAALGFLDFSTIEQPRRQWIERLYGRAGYAALAVTAPHLVVNSVKFAVGRTRPSALFEVGPFAFKPLVGGDLYASFPSGHSATCGAVAMILALWFPRWRFLILPAGAVFAISRIAAQAHYASDVVAGFSIGVLTALFIARWLAGRHIVFRPTKDRIVPKAT